MSAMLKAGAEVALHAGDWFNRLDFTMRSNNYGVGLPPKEKNEATWPLKRKLLGDAGLKPWTQDIEQSWDVFRHAWCTASTLSRAAQDNCSCFCIAVT